MSAPGDSSAQHLMARPGVQRFPSARLELFTVRKFLSAAECNALIARIEAERMPSTIADTNGDAAFRTSETCHFSLDDPVTLALEYKLHALNGIALHHGEPLQGQRYEAGQEFKAHTDYFDPWGADYERFCAGPGQRTWTFMIYLNDVATGGATRFKAIDKTIQPERGKLLGWNNRLPDGTVNPDTLHHAMKVRKGLKYVITKWYRERPWT